MSHRSNSIFNWPGKHLFYYTCIILVVFFWSVTAFPGQESYTRAALQDEIIDLPDAPQYSQRQFSGYVDVANNTHHMFYWFIEAKNPNATQIVFWTNGGPGCSSLIGLFALGIYEPVPADNKSGVKLQFRSHTWNENAHIVFWEQPAVGFTWLNDGTSPREWTDQLAAQRNVEFFLGWFQKFPQYQQLSMYLAGESYAGHYVPTTARAMLSAPSLFPHFSGVFIGNPLIYLPYRDYGQMKSYIDRRLVPYWGVGKQFIEQCQPDPTTQPNPPTPLPEICSKIEQLIDSKYLVHVDPYGIDYPVCVSSSGQLELTSGLMGQITTQQIARAQRTYKQHTIANNLWFNDLLRDINSNDISTFLRDSPDEYFPKDYEPCVGNLVTAYLNRADVITAIHAKKPWLLWTECTLIAYSASDQIESMLPVYKNNYDMSKGTIRQVIYSGTDDSMCSTVETEMAFFNNGFDITGDNWAPISYKGQLLGYKTEMSHGVTIYTVHGAGHAAAQGRPEHTKYLFDSFLQQEPK